MEPTIRRHHQLDRFQFTVATRAVLLGSHVFNDGTNTAAVRGQIRSCPTKDRKCKGEAAAVMLGAGEDNGIQA